jgi:hypothetical protein
VIASGFGIVASKLMSTLAFLPLLVLVAFLIRQRQHLGKERGILG